MEMKNSQQNQNLALMKELYVISFKLPYLIQKKDGKGYTTTKWTIKDNAINNHLEHKQTIGVFAGTEFTKFICFDIDCEDPETMLRNLMLVLTDDFDLTREQILVSFSGKKGYHVELFFDEAIRIEHGRRFYEQVLKVLGANFQEVEFRPTNGQGVKLPLGIHRGTNKVCYLMDSYTFVRKAPSHLAKVKKINKDNFVSKHELDHKPVRLPKVKVDEAKKIIEGTNHHIPSNVSGWCKDILKAGMLTQPSSRHNATYHLSQHLKDEYGMDKDSVKDVINEILSQTFKKKPHFFSSDTTEEYAMSQVERLVDYVFDNNKSINEDKGYKIRIYKEELLEVLEQKRIGDKKLAYIMLVHSKKFSKKDGTFYMTYKQMTQMGATTEKRSHLLQKLKQLEENGFLTIVESNRKNGNKHLPNIYKVNATTQEDCIEYIEFESTDESSLIMEKVVAQLIPEGIVKRLVAKKQFYEVFKPMYKAM